MVSLHELYFLQELDLALGLAGLGAFCPEPFDEPCGFLHFLLLVFCPGFQGFLLLFPGLQVVVVVAAVKPHAFGLKTDDPVGLPVEEFAVMADEHHGAAEGFQISFEPVDGKDVKVVGGLVQEKKIGTLVEQACQGRPHFPPAAQGSNRFLEIPGAEPQAQEDLLRFMHRIAGVEVRHFMVKFGKLRSEPGLGFCVRAILHLLLDPFHLLPDPGPGRDRIDQVGEKGAGEGFIDVLGQVPHAGAFCDPDLAGIGVHVAHHKPQDRGLS